MSIETSTEHGSLEKWLEVIDQITGGTHDKTLLDLMCGECSGTRSLMTAGSLHVDCHDWPNRPKDLSFMLADVTKTETRDDLHGNHWDIALCSDGLEHTIISDGLDLLDFMTWVSDIAIIFTPVGKLYNDLMVDNLSNKPDAHKSAWHPLDFHCWGWDVILFPQWHMPASPGLGAMFAWKKS